MSAEDTEEPVDVASPLESTEAAVDISSDGSASMKMSQSLPFMENPSVLTGELAGDVGFDPLGFAKTSEDLMNYREAEVKHARLAMLAAAGWPMSELLDKKLALAFGMAPLVDGSDRVPSLLNGGLGKVSIGYWLGCLGLAAAVDLYGTSRKSSLEYAQPGDLGFDPLGLYPEDKEGQLRMQLAEIKNGRLAMIAIFGFAVQEFVTKMGVVDETPAFFMPASAALKMYTNQGYIQ
eukprot:CAMPEP_0178940380 /NCGR_PEP_ID=MMETSP0789-20121207/777_1 /TAXON_ID=3005 /ORGANISM="Rhizosolenia setigera, Strain CCMP 1694" /LENGTH=234 /DNA_ID=CAMNT_0020619413 /DNA_START=257 /DNA_END=961 /DNA_ORIENTATION=+